MTEAIKTRVAQHSRHDLADLRPELEKRAAAKIAETIKDLTQRGAAEASSLEKLLQAQRDRIGKAARTQDQADLFANDDERRQREADRRHWASRLERLERELQHEPQRVRQAYDVRAHRLEPIGLVYLWPASG